MNLVKIRKEKNLTQEDMSSKIGMSRSGYAMYETGDRQMSANTAKKIAEILDCTVDELLAEDTDDEARV